MVHPYGYRNLLSPQLVTENFTLSLLERWWSKQVDKN